MLIRTGKATVVERVSNAHLTGKCANDHQDDIPTIGKFMLEKETRRIKLERSLTKTYDFEYFQLRSIGFFHFHWFLSLFLSGMFLFEDSGEETWRDYWLQGLHPITRHCHRRVSVHDGMVNRYYGGLITDVILNWADFSTRSGTTMRRRHCSEDLKRKLKLRRENDDNLFL